MSKITFHNILQNRWFWLMVGLVLIEIAATSLIPTIRGTFYGYIEAKDILVWTWLALLFFNNFVFDFSQSSKNYVIVRLAQDQRKIQTEKIGSVSNYEIAQSPQRLQEDVKLMYHNKITVLVEYCISGGILVWLIINHLSSFWLILGALAYAVVSIVVAYLFNPKLKYAEKIVQSEEAAFRINLAERTDIFGLNTAIKANFKAAQIRLGYLLFSRLQGGILLVLPYLVLLPTYLAGGIGLGELVKMSTVFQLMVVNAAILINIFPLLTTAHASAERVNELKESKK